MQGKFTKLLGGIGIGAGLMYLFDPQTGRRRRAQLEQKAGRDARQMASETGKAWRDVGHRARGLMARAAGLFGRRAQPDDVILEERVRARLGRLSSHPGAIELACEDGTVLLAGYVLREEQARLIEGIARIPGVRGVQEMLQVREEAGSIPALQGTPNRLEPWWRREHWSPTPRVVGTGAGLWMLMRALRKGGFSGTLWGFLGLALTVRGMVNRPWRHVVGLAGRGVEIRKSIFLKVPVSEVYTFWRAFDTFPLFMSHVKEVRPLPEGRFTWRVEGPGGIEFDWQAELTSDIPDREIAWRSLPGSSVETEGTVRFSRRGDGTQVDVQLSYNPPAGAVGHAVAKLLGKDAKREIDEDLIRFKSLLETGRATGNQTVTREQVAEHVHRPPAGA